MKVRVGDLRRLVRETLDEVDVYEPGKEPIGEPLTMSVRASELLLAGPKGFVVPSKYHGKIRLKAKRARIGRGIEIFDASGKKVLTLKPEQTVTIEA